MIIVGHRGARGLAQENTLASFQAALDHDVDEIEFDVRVTKDNVPIMYHDAELHAEHGKTRPINQQTYDEIKAGFPDLTTLAEAIAFVNKRVPLLIEVKPNEPIEPIVKVIQDFLSKGWQPTDFLLASFSFTVLRALHIALPDIKKVVNEGWSSIRAVRRMKALNTNRTSMNYIWLWSGFVRAMSNRGYQLGTYTLNSPRTANRWAKYNLYATITDYPDRFVKPS